MPSPRAAVGSPGNDADGFEAFYLATSAGTFKAAYRMSAGDQHLAADATQEAYLAMLRCWPTRRERELDDNRRYVIGIAAKKIVDWYRVRDNRCAALEEADCPAGEPTHADTLSELAVFNAVRNLLDGQPARRRAVGVLFFLEEWPDKKIAAELGIKESTVRTHVYRLRRLLKPLICRINDLNPGGAQR